jgi:hypothetical protein
MNLGRSCREVARCFNSHAKLHAPAFGQRCIEFRQLLLDLRSASDGFEGAGELDKQTVSGLTDQPAAVPGQSRFNVIHA